MNVTFSTNCIKHSFFLLLVNYIPNHDIYFDLSPVIKTFKIESDYDFFFTIFLTYLYSYFVEDKQRDFFQTQREIICDKDVITVSLYIYR
jgi:hypothetical protein